MHSAETGRANLKKQSHVMKRTHNIATLCLVAIVLSGCSVPHLSMPDISMPSFGWFGSKDKAPTLRANTNNTEETAREVTPTNPRDIALDTEESDSFSVQKPDLLTRPLGADQSPNTQNTPESAQPNTDFNFRSLGMNAEPLFMRPVNSPDERFRRLEQAVQAIRTDINNMAPSLARLISVEEDLQLLIGELQVLLEEEAEPEPTEFLIPSAPAPLSTVRGTPRQPVQTPDRQRQRTPSPMLSQNEQQSQINVQRSQDGNTARNMQFSRPGESADNNNNNAGAQARQVPLTRPSAQPSTPSTPSATAPAASQRASSRSAPAPYQGRATVTDVRIGEYDDKMRIVFDLSSRAEYETDFDAFENIFSLILPEAAISPSARINRLSGSLINGATISPYGEGQIIAIDLNGNTDLINSGAIEPTGGNGNFRLFFDFAK